MVALVSLVAFEAMAVATAMPVAARELDGLGLYAWAFTGFLVSSLFATAVAGQLCDRRGTRLPFLAGVALFAVGLVLSGSAQAMVPFVFGRLVQGLGAGGILVPLYVLVAQVYPDTMRPRIFSYLSAAWVVPSVVGPLVAGTLAENLSWRWVFIGLLPLVVAPVLLLLPDMTSPSSTGTKSESDASLPPSRVLAAFVVAVGAALVQLGGQQVQQGRTAVGVAVGGTVALAGVAGVAGAVRRLMPAGIARLRRGLPSVVALRGLQAGAFFGLEAFLPLMLVVHRGLSPTAAGAVLTGAALGWSAGSWWQGRSRLGTDRTRLPLIGALTVLGGLGVTATAVLPEVPVTAAVVGWVVAGSGMGVTLSTLSVLLLRLSAAAEQGTNAAALQMADSLGCVLTVGIGGVVYAALRHEGGWAFGAVYAGMLAVQLVSVLVSTRVAPDTPRPPPDVIQRAGDTAPEG
jgi:MFS family permease